MSDTQYRDTRPYGIYEGDTKDNVYLFTLGHIYTTPFIVANINTRFFANVALTLGESTFSVGVGGNPQHCRAVAVRPATTCFVDAKHTKLVSLNINPLHRHFRTLCLIPAPGTLTLDRQVFAEFDSELNELYAGHSTTEQALALHERVFDTAVRFLPQPDPLDLRIRRILDSLEKQPDCTLEELASIARLSYKRASLLFAQNVGLPLKSFLLWKKLHRFERLAGEYGPTRSITEIAHEAGFVDSAHLCRTFQEIFRASPSYFFANPNVRVRSLLRHGPMSPMAESTTTPQRGSRRESTPSVLRSA